MRWIAFMNALSLSHLGSIVSRLQPRVRGRTLFRIAVGLFAILFAFEFYQVVIGSNFHTLIPDRFYRSAQLSAEELDTVIHEHGIRTVINLRGHCPRFDWYRDECRTTHLHGVNQENITLSANRLPPPSEIHRLVEVLERAEQPILLHCRRGADRTGLASALTLLLLSDSDWFTARLQCSPRYGHLGLGTTEAMDAFFAMYADHLKHLDQEHSPTLFRDWLIHGYCPGVCRAELSWLSKPSQVPMGASAVFRIRATNRSLGAWELRPGTGTGVHVRYQVCDASGVVQWIDEAGQFSASIAPGGTIELDLPLPPFARPGRYILHVDMIDAQDHSFLQAGSEPLMTEFLVKAE